jgi:integrase
MAHIQRRGNRWQARYRAPDGKERSRTFDRKVDAQAFLATVESSKLRNEWVEPRLGRQSFGNYASEWMTTKVHRAARTRINVEGRLRNHILPAFGGTPLSGVRPTDVRSWFAALNDSGLAPETVKAIYLVLRGIFDQAVTEGLVARSPCIGIELPPTRQREEMHFLSPEDVNRLAAAIDDRYRVLIYTAAYGGLRAGELHALKIGRMNLLATTLEVSESLSEVRGRHATGPTKTGRPRVIALPRFLAEMLGEHVGRYPSADGYVFTSAGGGPIRHRNFYRRHFRPAVARAGLPDGLRFHDLRHTCAAFLIANGRHMEEVKDHLGHSSIRVTSDRYGHLFPAAKAALAESLDAIYRATPAVSSRSDTTVVALQTRKAAP